MSNMISIDRKELNAMKETITDLGKVAREKEALEAKVAALEAQLAASSALTDTVEIADQAYQLINAAALGTPADTGMAPTGNEPEIRDHVNFKVAFERILDGFDRALNGYRSSKGRTFNGLVQNEAYWRKELAKLRAAGDQIFLTDGRPTKDARYAYERWVETATLMAKLEEVQQFFLSAYDKVSISDEYRPFEERMEEWNARKEKEDAAAEKSARDISAMLSAAPGQEALKALLAKR